MQDMSTQRASLHKVLELRNGHPDLVDPLLEAYHHGCPVACSGPISHSKVALHDSKMMLCSHCDKLIKYSNTGHEKKCPVLEY